MVYQFLANGVVISDYSASASCVWTPTLDGIYQLTVNAMDLNGADPTQVISSSAMAYTVLPLAVADNYSVIAGETLTVSAANGLLANDLGSDTLTVAGYTNPANGTLTLNDDGSFTYQPTAGFCGTDTFTYTAGGRGATSTPATVTITVYSIPVANAMTLYRLPGSTLTVTAPGVLANDSNADGGPLTACLSHRPSTWPPDAQCGRLLQLYAESRLLRHGYLHLHRDGWPCHLHAGDGDHHRLFRPGGQYDAYTVIAGSTLERRCQRRAGQ